jgi:hypothetical protein
MKANPRKMKKSFKATVEVFQHKTISQGFNLSECPKN